MVLGGTGKTGRRVAARLWQRGVPVRIGSRSAEPAFDWEDTATWPDALKNVEAAYVSYYPDLAAPGAAHAIRAFAELAVRNGVRRIVLLSGRGEVEAERCEQMLKNSGADWTILRASWFSQNFSENFLVESVVAGEVALPVGRVGEPFVDANDIADVAVAALTEDGHANQLYELTGPRLWTFEQAVAEIAGATERNIRYFYVSLQQYASALMKQGVPSEFVTLVLYLFTEVLDGRNASVVDGVQRALGRPPRDFTEYVRETAASGVWHEIEASRPQAAAPIGSVRA